jgi:hypothetical protein
MVVVFEKYNQVEKHACENVNVMLYNFARLLTTMSLNVLLLVAYYIKLKHEKRKIR